MREISVRIFDDLDFKENGTRNEACVTLNIGLNGVWRELDVTAENEKEIRDTLDRLMSAGREPEVAPEPPSARSKFGPNPAKAAYNERLREWVRETGLKNSSGSGWAYQTNVSLADYIGEPLIRKYEAHLKAQKEAKGDG